MCTSIVSNRKKTVIGWNLDLLDMDHRVTPSANGVFIEVYDRKEGWMPLFGANSRGDFVGMPTCWPYDQRSDPSADEQNIIMLDMDLLLGKKTLEEIRHIAETEKICSVPGVTFMGSLSDRDGKEFRSFAEIYDGVDTPIPPHSSVTFSHEGIRWGAQSVPASVTIGISSVKTESELPAVQLPQAGELLVQALGDEKLAAIREDPPVEIAFHVDQGGYGRTAVFREGEELDKAVQLLSAVRIAGEAEEYVSDNYNWIRLTWADGSTSVLSLNLRNLEISVHSLPRVYALEGLDAFWTFAAGYLIEDE